MINLIPPVGHATLKREYLLRVGSIYGFMLGGICIAGVALLIPTFVLVHSQLSTSEQALPQMTEEAEEFRASELTIKETNVLILQLAKSKSDTSASVAIENIVALSSSYIEFKTFQLEKNNGVIKDIVVQGNATSRTELAAFKNRIGESPFFKSAQIPISDLARESDLPFVLTVTIATSTKNK